MEAAGRLSVAPGVVGQDDSKRLRRRTSFVVQPQRINPAWAGESCFVAASGPSLTAEVAHRVRMARWQERWRVIAVSDAYRLMPWADILYSCDNAWWEHHQGAKEFRGDRWACHEQDPNPRELHGNDKRELAQRFGINLVRGVDSKAFSMDPSVVSYGDNTGFQALNLAMHFGCSRIVLIGFDMRHVDGKAHFFGDHPKALRNSPDDVYKKFAKIFQQAAKALPERFSIVNATPGSALTCFPRVSLDDVFKTISGPNDCVSGNGTELHASAG